LLNKLFIGIIHLVSEIIAKGANVSNKKIRWNIVCVFILISFLNDSNLIAQIRLVDENLINLELPSPLEEALSNTSRGHGDLILQWFASLGYLNVQVSELETNTCQVIRGCLFSASLNGLGDDKPTIQFTESNVELLLSHFVEKNIREGRYFSTVEIESLKPNIKECTVEIDVRLIYNEEVFLREIHFTGNRLNDNEYLIKRSYFRDSLLAMPENLAKLSSNILQTQLFERVTDSQVLLRRGIPIVLFDVEEKSLNQFDGVLGYVPSTTGSGDVVGDALLSLWSVFAEGNGLDMRYRRLEPEVSRFELTLSQHWFGYLPLGISAGFNLFQNDTTYQSRQVQVDGYFELGSGVHLLGDVSFTAITGTDFSSATIEPGGKKQKTSIGISYSDVYATEIAREGFSAEIRFGFVNNCVDLDSISALGQQTVQVKATKFFPIGKQSLIASKVNSFLLISDTYTDVDLLRFGGANSLRGFTEEQFQASQIIWGDLEYKFLTNASSYLFGFVGAGWFHRPKLITESNAQFKTTKFIQSLGFGLSYKVRTGRLKFTYAISPNQTLSNGKIHVALTTRL
jgi:hypothetical protein